MKVEDVVDAADRTIVVGRFGGRTAKTQTDFNVPFCQLWKFREGKAAEAEYWNDSGAVMRALGLLESATSSR